MTGRPLLVLSVLFALTACGGGRAASAAAERPAPVTPATGGVRVANHHRSTVSVSATTGGTTRRLGYVEKTSTAVFTFPIGAETGDAVEITLQSLATEEEYSTGPIPVSSCALIELTAAWDLASSGVWMPGR
jgi:hypothetical protein